MWSALSAVGNLAVGAVSVVGNAVVATGGLVGLGPGEYPPANLPSNYPFQKHKNNAERVDWCHGHLYAEFLRIMDGPEWQPIEYTDPEGGDIALFSQPIDQTHHFLKATFSLKATTPEKVVSLVASESLAVRQTFGPNMEHCDYYFKDEKGTTALLYTKFWAPPPTAGRDFIFVQGRKTLPCGAMEVWGSSIDDDATHPEDNVYYVRGASCWGWRVSAPDATGTCQLTYFNVSDPRGWCPSWIFSYIKTQCSHDLTNIRNIIHGKEVVATKLDLEEMGYTQEDIMKEQQKAPATQE